MRRMMTIAIAGMVLGVVMAGAGIVRVDHELVKSAKYYGIVSVGMGNNASFLAPMPINYSIIQLYAPYSTHDFFATPRMISTD
ncbi:MAG TPA: hypothetical protein ENG06_06225 [Thermoplasmatales archaeon]|nr:hypothetical protein [Thermoplasmatales archaeon]